MSKRNIQIDQLEIRLSGVPPETARAAAGGLGQELLRRLGEQSLPAANRNARIREIDIGPLRVSPRTSPAALRDTVAQRIAGSIGSLNPRKIAK